MQCRPLFHVLNMSLKLILEEKNCFLFLLLILQKLVPLLTLIINEASELCKINRENYRCPDRQQKGEEAKNDSFCCFCPAIKCSLLVCSILSRQSQDKCDKLVAIGNLGNSKDIYDTLVDVDVS